MPREFPGRFLNRSTLYSEEGVSDLCSKKWCDRLAHVDSWCGSSTFGSGYHEIDLFQDPEDLPKGWATRIRIDLP